MLWLPCLLALSACAPELKVHSAAGFERSAAAQLSVEDTIRQQYSKEDAAALLEQQKAKLNEDSESIRKSPEAAVGYRLRAQLYHKMGRLPEAIQDLNKAL